MTTVVGHETHPAADIFPLLEGAEFEALCADIKEHGLRTPIVRVWVDGGAGNGTRKALVLDGRNRLRACMKTGVAPDWTDYEGDSPVAYVISTNLKRRNLTPSQAAACAAEMLPVLEAEAKERQRLAGTHGSEGGRGRKKTLVDAGPEGFASDEGRAREQAGAAFGVSGRHVQRAKRLKEEAPDLHEAVKAGSLDIATALKAASMDEQLQALVLGKVKSGDAKDGKAALRAVQREQATTKIESEPQPLPDGPFRVIVADPPWAYEKRKDDGTHRAALTYPSMTTDELCAMPVGVRAHEDCVLWLWTTNAFMRDAFRIIDAWGFTEKTILTWAKDRMGTGDWLRGKTEHCIMAVRGAPLVNLTNQTTLLNGPVREHSRKPDEFYALVEALCPGSKLEIFAREQRAGWQCWGAESEKFETTDRETAE